MHLFAPLFVVRKRSFTVKELFLTTKRALSVKALWPLLNSRTVAKEVHLFGHCFLHSALPWQPATRTSKQLPKHKALNPASASTRQRTHAHTQSGGNSRGGGPSSRLSPHLLPQRASGRVHACYPGFSFFLSLPPHAPSPLFPPLTSVVPGT